MLTQLALMAALAAPVATDEAPRPAPPVRLVVATAIGVAAAVAATVVVSAATLVLLAAIATPIGLAWATGDGQGFQPVMFGEFVVGLVIALFLPFVPLALLAGGVADAAGFTFTMHFLDENPLAAMIAAGVALLPGAALIALSLSLQLVLLGLLGSVGASSMGRRLPGDPGGNVYFGLVVGSGVALAAGLGAQALSMLLLRPGLHRILTRSSSTPAPPAPAAPGTPDPRAAPASPAPSPA